jgi:hypothetical protein
MNAAQGRDLSNADQTSVTRKKPQATYEVSGEPRVV